MTFRVKIISPLEATEADLARRQSRYAEQARPDTHLLVENLHGGPASLNTAGDVLASAAAIYHQGKSTSADEYDAILIDCVFDPAVEELREATGLPTFGPTNVTLPFIPLVASKYLNRRPHGETMRAFGRDCRGLWIWRNHSLLPARPGHQL